MPKSAPFTIVSSPAMQAAEEAAERQHLADTAAKDQALLDDKASPDWRTVEHAEEILSRIDTSALCAVQVLDAQNDARGREIQRLRAELAAERRANSSTIDDRDRATDMAAR